MPVIQQGSAALAAYPAVVCSVMYQRITITPSNVLPGGLGDRGPVEDGSFVLVSGLSDGIYDV